MKTIFKIFSVAAASALMLTGCIEETFPESGYATTEQIGASATALEASLNGIPSQMSQGYLIYGSQTYEYDMAYPQFMLEFSEMLGDFYPLGGTGYDWYVSWNACTGMGESTGRAYVPWRTLYMFVKSANDIISSVDVNSEDLTDTMKGYAGIAYACRAFNYYMLMVLYEPVANIYTDCSSVLGLTVPIVTDETDGETSKNNPRATHDEMVEFILSDLAIAESCLENYTPSSKLYPSLAVVYAIMARVYMWDKDYSNAATYARKAIDTFGGTPVTESQWLDVNTGFNTANQAWMWYIHYDAENMGNLCNFTGWITAEADWGYASLTYPGIDRSLYDKIANTDFRKYTFIDPDKFDFYDYVSAQGDEFIENAPDYLSIKFRCGSGDYESYSVGGAVDVPVMRIEEMYLIEAEAVAASSSVSSGVSLLNTFMQTYRQPDYNFSATSLEALQEEILTQMRIEFWGEGTALPTAKRLQFGVMQNYSGTNAPADNLKINCAGIKPNWNFVIPISEVQANTALDGYNNPDPTSVISYPSTEGEYAPGNY